MKVCDLCGDIEIVVDDGDVHFCKKHAIEHYLKLHGIDNSEPVTLVQVFPENTSHFSDEFIEYDTVYYEKGKKKNYPLKDGMECLVLLFVDSSGKLFSTIRRSTPSKDIYYMTAIGIDFRLEVS